MKIRVFSLGAAGRGPFFSLWVAQDRPERIARAMLVMEELRDLWPHLDLQVTDSTREEYEAGRRRQSTLSAMKGRDHE